MNDYIEKLRKNGTVTAVAYCRFSSDMQREESIDAQLRAIHSFAKANNIKLIYEYIDRAQSATSADRPAFQKMLTDAQRQQFSLILVHKLDRFSRDRYVAMAARNELMRSGVRVFSVTEQLDDSPEAKLMESLLDGMAEFYSLNLAREVEKGKRENALQCKHVGGVPPLGYDVDPFTRKLVINETEAPAIRMIFEMYRDGYGYTEIIKALNSNGYRTKRGGKFGKNSLYEILINPKYMGTYVYNRSAAKDVDGKYHRHRYKDESEIIRIKNGNPAIVSEELFQAVQEKMKESQHRAGKHNAKETYLLSGKLICGECGSTYTGNCRKARADHPQYVSYRCTKKNGKASCRNKEIRRETLEQLVLERLAEKIFSPTLVPLIAEQINAYAESKDIEARGVWDTIQKRLKKIDTELTNVVNVIAATGSMSLNKKLMALEEEKATLTQRLEQLQYEREQANLSLSDVKRLFQKAKKLFAQGTLPANKKLIDLFVHHVTIYADKIEIQYNLLPQPTPPTDPHKNTKTCAGSLLSDLFTVEESRKDNASADNET